MEKRRGAQPKRCSMRIRMDGCVYVTHVRTYLWLIDILALLIQLEVGLQEWVMKRRGKGWHVRGQISTNMTNHKIVIFQIQYTCLSTFNFMLFHYIFFCLIFGLFVLLTTDFISFLSTTVLTVSILSLPFRGCLFHFLSCSFYIFH